MIKTHNYNELTGAIDKLLNSKSRDLHQDSVVEFIIRDKTYTSCSIYKNIPIFINLSESGKSVTVRELLEKLSAFKPIDRVVSCVYFEPPVDNNDVPYATTVPKQTKYPIQEVFALKNKLILKSR